MHKALLDRLARLEWTAILVMKAHRVRRARLVIEATKDHQESLEISMTSHCAVSNVVCIRAVIDEFSHLQVPTDHQVRSSSKI